MAMCSRILTSSFINKCLNSSSITVIHTKGFKRFVAPTIRHINARKKKEDPIPIEKTKRSSYLEWNHNAELYAFGKRLGEDFKIELLLQAFVCRSYIVQEELKQQEVGIESPSLALSDNSQLATSGRKIISDEVLRFLSASLPRLPKECIQSIHDHIVSEERLAEISKKIGTSDIILTAEYPVEVATLSHTLEAVVGALAESDSLERANRFVVDIILSQLSEVDVNDLFDFEEPLKLLTDILARDGREAPEPRIIGQTAVNEILAAYTVGLYVDKQLIGKGAGETVGIAVEMAARESLKRLFKTTENAAPLRFNQTFSSITPSNLPLATWKASVFN